MNYETRRMRPLTHRAFLWRVAKHVAFTLLLALFSLAGGMAGYMHFEHLPWRDAFLNAAMLLGGMGPVDTPHTDGGKLFAGLYALYAGLVFMISLGIMAAPLVHRLLHTFHWEQDK